MSRGGVSFSVGRDHRDRDRCDQPPCSMHRPTPLHRADPLSLLCSPFHSRLLPLSLLLEIRENRAAARFYSPSPLLPLPPSAYREIIRNANCALVRLEPRGNGISLRIPATYSVHTPRRENLFPFSDSVVCSSSSDPFCLVSLFLGPSRNCTAATLLQGVFFDPVIHSEKG